MAVSSMYFIHISVAIIILVLYCLGESMEGREVLERSRLRLESELGGVIQSMTDALGKPPSLGDILTRCEKRIRGLDDNFFDLFSEVDCLGIRELVREKIIDVERARDEALSKSAKFGGGEEPAAGNAKPAAGKSKEKPTLE